MRFLSTWLVVLFFFSLVGVSPLFAQDIAVEDTVELPNYEDTLYIFDLESYLTLKPGNITWQYDVINFVSALQGLVNRTAPQLYVLYVRETLSGHRMNVDYFWLSYLRGGDNVMSKTKIVYLNTLEEVIQTFRHYFGAVTLWDPNVPATGNVALTIAGADGYLPVRHDRSPDSLFTQVVLGASQLPHGERLTGKFVSIKDQFIPNTDIKSTETQKGDAYLWAKTLYLDQGLCSPTHMGFFLDPYDWDQKNDGVQYGDLQNSLIVNHDFYVGKKAFFLDLDPWWNEIPTDIPQDPFDQGKDKKVLVQILQSAYNRTLEGDRILRIGGMVPWWVKYSNYQDIGGKFTPQQTVEEYISIMSAYNGVVDADSSPYGALANASVFQHIPLHERYFQNPVPSERSLEKKNYLLFAIGDFNSSALLYQVLPILWNDINRGMLPISWAYSPIVSERIPHVINYMYDTRTSQDYFLAGGTGPGLSYPNRFGHAREHSNIENGLPYWQKYAKDLYRKFDLRTTIAANLSEDKIQTAFFDQRLQQPFRQFSQQGVSTLKAFENPLDENVVPYIKESQVFTERNPSMNQIVNTILTNSRKDTPTFQLYRFKLATPTTLFYVSQRLQSEHEDYQFEVVDPFTFFYLLRQHYGEGKKSYNYLIPTFLSHTIKPELALASKEMVSVTLRNDGWDIWNEEGIAPERRYRLTYTWLYEGREEPIIGRQAAYVQGPVKPGETVVLDVLLESPEESGLYVLSLHFEQENVRQSNLKEEMRVVVY
jgi:hypothetical protein